MRRYHQRPLRSRRPPKDAILPPDNAVAWTRASGVFMAANPQPALGFAALIHILPKSFSARFVCLTGPSWHLARLPLCSVIPRRAGFLRDAVAHQRIAGLIAFANQLRVCQFRALRANNPIRQLDSRKRIIRRARRQSRRRNRVSRVFLGRMEAAVSGGHRRWGRRWRERIERHVHRPASRGQEGRQSHA